MIVESTMVDKTTVERILADKIPYTITCGNCECEVELNEVNFDTIYEALVKAEEQEIRLEQHEPPK